jgi:hypothetical protein
MSRIGFALALTGSILALAACNKSGETAKTDAPASAGPVPTPAAGLWEQTMSGMPGMGDITMQVCLDAATAGDYGASQTSGDCTRTPAARGLDGSITFAVTCNTAAGTVKSSGKVSGDVSRDYTVDMTMETTGAPTPEANGVRTMSLHAVHKGECPADMAPGKAKIMGMPAMPGMPAGMKIPTMPTAPK